MGGRVGGVGWGRGDVEVGEGGMGGVWLVGGVGMGCGLEVGEEGGEGI